MFEAPALTTLACLPKSRGALICAIREDPIVPDGIVDPHPAYCYYVQSGSLIYELESRLPRSWPLFKSDNMSVCMKIEKATREKYVESKINSFYLRKDGRGAFQAFITNKAGEIKHWSISKKRLFFAKHQMELLGSSPWDPWSNHMQVREDMLERSAHIKCAVPGPAHKVENLIDIINCVDSTLQNARGLVRTNTNNMQ